MRTGHEGILLNSPAFGGSPSQPAAYGSFRAGARPGSVSVSVMDQSHRREAELAQRERELAQREEQQRQQVPCRQLPPMRAIVCWLRCLSPHSEASPGHSLPRHAQFPASLPGPLARSFEGRRRVLRSAWRHSGR
jgi:hypothetical protein